MDEQTANPAPAPFPLALLLCDSVITDEDSKKKTLVGIFDRILVQKFPTAYRPLTIYARLIDAEGTYDFRVEYVQVKTDKILAQGSFSGIKVEDRLSPIEILLTLPSIPIPKPGQYEFRIWANKFYVGRISFIAEKISQKGVQS